MASLRSKLLDLHRKNSRGGCSECRDAYSSYQEPWPCPTVNLVMDDYENETKAKDGMANQARIFVAKEVRNG